MVYSPDRLLFPQLRCGARGNSQFSRTSWDQALNHVASGLQEIAAQHGPEALCIYTGRGNFEFGLNETFAPAGTVESSANTLLFPLGSPNTAGVGSLCYAAFGMIATRACSGTYMRDILFDLDNADLILVWGANPATDSPPSNLRRLMRATQRGAQVVVIDHRRTATVKAARARWIGVRPGTDGALALGLMQVLIAEGIYQHAFVEQWTEGFEELSQYAASFTPSKVAEITGVPAETIVDLARQIARARGCCPLMYTGLEYSNSGVQAIRALWCLMALAGHLDKPGTAQFRMPERLRPHRLLTEAPKSGRPAIGADAYPLYHQVRNEAHATLLPRAILEGDPYPVRALIIAGSSIITAWPNPSLWRRALAALDLLVIINRFPTADSAYADVILPAATLYECESFMFYDGLVQHRARLIPPLGESRSDYQIFADLAKRLGLGDRWPADERAMVERALRGTGISYQQLEQRPEGIPFEVPTMQHEKFATGQLRPDGLPGFNTPSGRFEFTSHWLQQAGYDALPRYTEPVEGPLAAPEVAAEFPLVLNTGARTRTFFRSQHLNVESLARIDPDPCVEINVRDAQARGISDGERVEVRSPRGSQRFRALVSEAIVPGVVEVNVGGGGPLGPKSWQQSNANVLTDLDNTDPISGFPVLKALLCQVSRLQQTF